MKLERVDKTKLHYLRINPVNGTYWVSAYDGKHQSKKRLERSTGVKGNKTRAEFEAEKIYQEWKNQKSSRARRSETPRKFSEVSAEVLIEYDQSSRDIDTKTNIRSIVRLHLDPFFGEMLVSEITRKTAQEYVSDFQSRRPHQTLGDKCKYFNKVMSHAFDEGYVDRKVTMENPDSKEAKGRALDEVEQQRLLQAAHGDAWFRVVGGLCHALRPEECGGMEYSWITPEGVLVIPAEKNKNRKVKRVPLHPSFFQALMRRKEKAEGVCVFPSRFDPNRPMLKYRKAWTRLKKLAQIDETPIDQGGPGRLRVDDLRHTWLTQAARNLRKQHEISLGILKGALEKLKHASKEEAIQLLSTAIIETETRKIDYSIADICTFAQHSITVFQKRYLRIKAEELVSLTNVIAVKLREVS